MSWAVAHGTEQEAAESEQLAREQTREAVVAYAAEQKSSAPTRSARPWSPPSPSWR